MKNNIVLKRAAAEAQSEPWERRKKPKKRADSALVENLSIADLRPFMHLTLEQAAEELKVGTTVLKRIARKCGIPKWPSRQIGWLNLKIEALKSELHKATPAMQTALQMQMSKLEQTRDEVYETGKVAPGFIKQWNAKHPSDGNATEEEATSDADDMCSSSPQSSVQSTPVVDSFAVNHHVAYPLVQQPQPFSFDQIEQKHAHFFDMPTQAFQLPYNSHPQMQSEQPQQFCVEPVNLPDVHFDLDDLDELNQILMTFADDDYHGFEL